jgi:hypothetical protein
MQVKSDEKEQRVDLDSKFWLRVMDSVSGLLKKATLERAEKGYDHEVDM